MDDSERRILEAIATVSTNQEITNTHVQYIKEKMEKVEKKLETLSEKDISFGEKIASLEEKTRCLPDIEQKVYSLEGGIKKRNKIWYGLAAVLTTLSLFTLGMSQTCSMKSCSIEEFNSSNSVNVQTENQ